MKKLPIYSDTFKAILSDFKRDLGLWNYSDTMVYYMPIHLREFFHYLETKGHHNLEHVSTGLVTKYYKHLSQRKNQRRSGALSNESLNKHQQALKLLLKYIKRRRKPNFGVHLKYEKRNALTVKDILTVDEVKELFDACAFSHVTRQIRLRDKAMLTLMYCYGLRTHQVEDLNLSDVDLENGRIIIKSGAQNKKRKQPYQVLLPSHIKALSDYIYLARPLFYNAEYCDAFFVTKNGGRMQGRSHSNRLQAIIEATENDAILEKNIRLHNLRHSIATHLLINGMPLRQVSDFLGHSSLESTQIYTHLAEQLNA